MTKSSLFVSKQIPEHIRAAHPKFVRFLSAYYAFNEKVIDSFAQGKDVDQISNNLLPFLRDELARGFGTPIIDERKFIANVRQLVSRKGTFDATKLLFKLFYDDTITIDEPNKQILRVSDGKWIQNKFFHIETIIPFDVNQLHSIEVGLFSIPVRKCELIDTGIYRVFVDISEFLQLKQDDEIILKNTANATIGRGFVVARATKFVIERAGKFWSVGDIIRIPGTIRDTLLRVVSVTNTGAIRNVEVFEHGYTHTRHNIVNVSPFPNRPFSLNYDINYTPVNIIATPAGVDIAYNIQLSLSNTLFSIDTLNYSSTTESYFAGSYTSQQYDSGTHIFDVNNQSGATINTPIQFPSMDDWQQSLTFIYAENEIITRDRGFYTNDSGKLSENNIRLHDGFFFQLFSYTIETTVNIDAYRNVLTNIHPAGTTYFGLLRKELSANLGDIAIMNAPSKNHSIESNSIGVATSVLTKGNKKPFDNIIVTQSLPTVEIVKQLDSSTTTQSTPLQVTDTGEYFIGYGSTDYASLTITMGNS